MSGGLRSVQMSEAGRDGAEDDADGRKASPIPSLTTHLDEDKNFTPDDLILPRSAPMLDELHRWAEALKPMRAIERRIKGTADCFSDAFVVSAVPSVLFQSAPRQRILVELARALLGDRHRVAAGGRIRPAPSRTSRRSGRCRPSGPPACAARRDPCAASAPSRGRPGSLRSSPI